MELTGLVDVAIGLIVIYVGASLFVTVINEYVAQVLNLRGRQLAKDLQKLIGGTPFVEYLKRNPALHRFFDGNGSKAPSYADPVVLAQTLLGSAVKDPAAGATLDTIVKGLNALPESELKQQLLALSQSTSKGVDELVKNVGAWADQTLTMMGDIYKERMQWISFGIGLTVAVLFNIDTIGVTTTLYRDKAARTAAIAVAENVTGVSSEDFEKCRNMPLDDARADKKCKPVVALVETIAQRNASLGKLPIGYSDVADIGGFLTALTQVTFFQIVGWVLTALALALGAPFWFDLLNKLVNVRHGMRKPAEVK